MKTYFFYSASGGFTAGNLPWCWRQYRHARDRGSVCGLYKDLPDSRGGWLRYFDGKEKFQRPLPLPA